MPIKIRTVCQKERVPKATMTAFHLVSAILISLVAILNAAEKNPKPDTILIIDEDQGSCDYGFMGSTTSVTPNLDRLAAQCQLYTHGYSMPVCSLSPATLLSGPPTHQHGITAKNLATQLGEEVKRLKHIRVSALHTH